MCARPSSAGSLLDSRDTAVPRFSASGPQTSGPQDLALVGPLGTIGTTQAQSQNPPNLRLEQARRLSHERRYSSLQREKFLEAIVSHDTVCCISHELICDIPPYEVDATPCGHVMCRDSLSAYHQREQLLGKLIQCPVCGGCLENIRFDQPPRLWKSSSAETESSAIKNDGRAYFDPDDSQSVPVAVAARQCQAAWDRLFELRAQHDVSIFGSFDAILKFSRSEQHHHIKWGVTQKLPNQSTRDTELVVWYYGCLLGYGIFRDATAAATALTANS